MNAQHYLDYDQPRRRDYDMLIRENSNLKQKILVMEEEQQAFVSLYASLIEDFKQTVNENTEYKHLVERLEGDIDALQATVNDLTMRDDMTNTSFRSNHKKKSPKCYSNVHKAISDESHSFNNSIEKLNNNQVSRPQSHGKSFLTLGSIERTSEQENRLRELARRSQARLQAIQSASVRRARITVQMKELIAYEINNSEYFDSATYESLEARLKTIEAFPYDQIRQDTLRRLKEFGYFDHINKKQVEKFNRAVRAVLTQAMSESNRRRSVQVAGNGNLRLDRFRRRME